MAAEPLRSHRNFDPRRLAALVVGFGAAFATIATLVVRDGVNVLYWDEWDGMPDYQRFVSGKLGLSGLWAQHNEHRLFLYRVVSLPLDRASRWNTRYEMYASLAVALLAALCLAALLASLPRLHLLFFAVSAALAGWLFFSPVQSENWLWGFQLQWFLTIFGLTAATAALVCLPRLIGPPAAVVVATCAALVGTLSTFGGLVIWPALLVVFLMSDELRRLTPAWILAGAASIALYLHGWSSPTGNVSLTRVFEYPDRYGLYALTYLGMPLSWFRTYPPDAALGGAVLGVFVATAVFVLVRRRDRYAAAAPWVALGAFAIGSAVVTSVGRLPYGLVQATSSRYTTNALMLVVGTVVLLALAIDADRPRRAARVAFFVIMAAVIASGLGLSYHRGVGLMRRRQASMQSTVKCIRAATTFEDRCLRRTYPIPALLWPKLLYARAYGLAGLAPR